MPVHPAEDTPLPGGASVPGSGPFDPASLNADLVDGEPTVDIDIFYPDGLAPAHRRAVSLDRVLDGVARAKQVFRAAGVQLALGSVRSGPLDPVLAAVHAEPPGSELPSSRYTNVYEDRRRRPARLSAEARAAFEAMVENRPDQDRRLHLLVLEDVYMSFYEQLDDRTWRARTIATGAMSFPGYSYLDTMPRHLRGVITITDLSKPHSWKTVAHELGHKLINASHEYREIDPRHEVYAGGGLLLYGQGVDIPSGREGRFHRERLHRSPFVYRRDAGCEKVWNPDYIDGGCYDDRIYGDLVVEIDPPVASSQ